MANTAVKKLFLLDGMALAYRAHFAFAVKPIISSSGFNTSAVYGFTATLLELIKNQQPTHLAVAFDTAAPTQRHVDFAEYKAQREAMPEDLSQGLPYIRKMIEALRIPILSMDGHEADDIIGTLAKRAEKENFTTYMVTSDKDFGQLVSPHSFIYKPSRMGDGVEILGVPEILKRWGILRVDQVVDILGLMGDASDNIPGVRGVGEKTAQKLIAQYDTIENLLEHTSELKGKLKESLEANRELALLSKKLATISLDVPVAVKISDLGRQEMDRTAIDAICRELEFSSLGRRLLGDDFKVTRGSGVQPAKAPIKKAASREGELNLGDAGNVETVEKKEPPKGKAITEVPHVYHTVTTKAERAELIARLKKEKVFCFDVETTSLDCKSCDLLGMAISFTSHEAYFVVFPGDRKKSTAMLEEFRPVLENETIEKVGHNLKFDLAVLRWHGFRVQGNFFDTMLAHALLEPDVKHTMDFLSEVYLGYSPIPLTQLIGEKKKEQIGMRDIPLEKLAEYGAEDADVTWQLRLVLEPLLKERGLERVFNEVESPLLPVLVEMEFEGIAIDPAVLSAFSIELEKQIDALEKQIYRDAGSPFNLNSPKQLGEVLFQKLNLVPGAKKTKTGQFATDEQTLQALAPQHEVIQRILTYREAAKLKSTYVDALPQDVYPVSGRIHTTFNQSVTSTGRLNSTNPNLQNIPIRTEQGREIRKAFVPGKKGFVLLAADYSQVELRIIAALSGDPALLEAFNTHVDIHQATASRIHGVDLKAVTPEMRRQAKMVNFGIIYGISGFGLGQRLGIPRQEATHIIDSYFQQYPKVKEYLNSTIEFARSRGYVETITGRRRYLRDITSANATVRAAAERNAINAPIQGTAADLIKIAMARIYTAFNERNLKTRMLLQVHDELVFEMAKTEEEIVVNLVQEKMKTALPELKVPIMVEIGMGLNWLQAHA
jgi:DNA polymerase I